MKTETLEEMGFMVGDLVLFDDKEKESGGIIFMIVDKIDPIKPIKATRTIVKRQKRFKPFLGKFVDTFERLPGINGEYEEYDEQVTITEDVDSQGKKITAMSIQGCVRIKPVFDFFASSKGKNPRGKNGTIVVYNSLIKKKLRHVDLVLLGSKYVELGNLMCELAKRGAETGRV